MFDTAKIGIFMNSDKTSKLDDYMRIANKLHKRVSNYLKTHPYIPDTVYPNVARTSRLADL